MLKHACHPLNTLSLPELEAAFVRTVASFSGRIQRGFQRGDVDRENGFPWFTVVGGQAGKHSAMAFCQALSDAMNVRVVLHAASLNCIQGAMDFDPDRLNRRQAPVSCCEDPSAPSEDIEAQFLDFTEQPVFLPQGLEHTAQEAAGSAAEANENVVGNVEGAVAGDVWRQCRPNEPPASEFH